MDWAHLRYRRHSLYDPGRWPRARSKVSAITDTDDDDEEIEDDPSRWSRYLIHVFRWYGPTRSSSDSHSRSDVVAAVDSDAMMVGGRWVVWARDRGDRASRPAEKKCEFVFGVAVGYIMEKTTKKRHP